MMVNKKFLLFVFFGMFLIACSYNVMAATVLRAPTAGTNHTGTLYFNCTTTLHTETVTWNVSLWYNATGGVVNSTTTGTTLIILANTSVGQTEFNISEASVSALNDAATYNMTCYADNGTDQQSSAGFVLGDLIKIDNTPPNVSAIVSPTTGSYYGDTLSGLLRLNVTISDNLQAYGNVTSVYFNVTTSSGIQNNTFTASISTGGSWWNATLNLSGFADGAYNVTIFSNDSTGNNNNTEFVTIYIDNTNPVVTLTSLNRGASSLTLSATITDLFDITCSVNRGSATISQDLLTLTETGLSCGTSYSYIYTCTDNVGNSGSSAATSVSTISCSGSTTGGASTIAWTKTVVVTSEQFKEGSTQQVAAKERIKVTAGGGTHHVGVKSLTTTSATIEIASNPITVILDIGEDAKVDVNEDGTYDLYVKLNNIVGAKADITIKELSEAVPEGEGSVSTTGDIEEEAETGAGIEGISKTWIWIIVIVVVVLVGIGFAVKKK